MARPPVVPAALTTGPFTLDDARRLGLSRRQLQGKAWRRLGAGTYAWAGLPDGPWLRLAAIQLRLPPQAAFAGRTAAWIHALDGTLFGGTVEVTLPKSSGVSGRVGVTTRRAEQRSGDVVVRQGLRTTSILRTLADLGRQLPLLEAVVAVDAALHLGLVSLAEMQAWSISRRGGKGLVRFRRLIELAEPESESPMETRLRLLLVLAGLPRPQAQVSINAADGEFLGRVDLYYPASRLAIEYDGGTHRERMTEDNRRQNKLLSAGLNLLRFTSPDIYQRPEYVIASVRAVLAEAA